MRLFRPAFALDTRHFGRRFPGFILGNPEEPGWTINDDVKLFATTFAAGFLFVSVVIF